MSALPAIRVQAKVFIQVSEEETKRNEIDTALLHAVENGDLAAVEKFDRRDLDLNVADQLRNTAVHKAMRHGVDILKYLTSRGAYPEFADSEGARPIAHAIRYDNTEAVEHLLSLKGEDGKRTVDLLQTITKSGNTLLHEAAWFDRPDSVKLLLQTGAYDKEALERSNSAGQTAMHIASFRSTTELIQQLAESGASVDAGTSSKRHIQETPMQMATAMGKEANAKYIQELGVAIQAIKFASRMRRRKNAKKPAKPVEDKAKADAEPTSVMNLRFDFDLKFFTADLEKAFIAKLATAVEVPPEQLFVLSRTAGSVILEIGVRDPVNMAATSKRVLSKVEAMSLEDLSTALGYKMLDRSVGPPTAKVEVVPPKLELPAAQLNKSASDSKVTPRDSPRRSTPGFHPMEQVGSARGDRPAQEV